MYLCNSDAGCETRSSITHNVKRGVIRVWGEAGQETAPGEAAVGIPGETGGELPKKCWGDPNSAFVTIHINKTIYKNWHAHIANNVCITVPLSRGSLACRVEGNHERYFTFRPLLGDYCIALQYFGDDLMAGFKTLGGGEGWASIQLDSMVFFKHKKTYLRCKILTIKNINDYVGYRHVWNRGNGGNGWQKYWRKNYKNEDQLIMFNWLRWKAIWDDIKLRVTSLRFFEITFGVAHEGRFRANFFLGG